MASPLIGLSVETLEKKATTLFAQHQCGQANGLICWLLRSLPRFSGWSDAMILDALLDREEICLAIARALDRQTWTELCSDAAAARSSVNRSQTAENIADTMLRRWRGLLEELSNHSSYEFALVALSRDEQIVPIIVHPAQWREQVEPQPEQLDEELEALCLAVASQPAPLQRDESRLDFDPTVSVLAESFQTGKKDERGLLVIGRSAKNSRDSATFKAQLALIRRVFRLDFETLVQEQVRQEAVQRLLFSEVQAKHGDPSMVTICAHCKAIKKGSGRTEQWSPVEQYLALGCGGSLSHGICPDCIERYYPTRIQPGKS